MSRRRVPTSFSQCLVSPPLQLPCQKISQGTDKHAELPASYYITLIIRLSPRGGGAYSKLDIQEGGLIREGALIQKEAFLRGDLFETHYVLKEAEFSPKKLSKS